MAGIVHPYTAVLKIGTVLLPALPRTRVMYPEGYETLDAVANTAYEVNFIAGLEVPVVEFNCGVQKTWFNATNLNAWFVTLTGATGVKDLAIIPSGATFWNGFEGMTIANAKGCRLDLSMPGKGMFLNARIQIMGTTITTGIADPGQADTFRENPARSQHVSFTGLTDPVSWSFTLDTGCTPNPEMGDTANLVSATGGVAPTEINFGRHTARVAVTLQSNKTLPADGTSMAAAINPPGGTLNTTTLTMPFPIWMGRLQYEVSPGQRGMRDYTAILRGTDAGAAPFSFATA